ncbi:MAG TPA: nuclear transport factor 2 family protein [Steroidobacteraceae bacterium]|nr:nuclear transport factor 2 family protein [Steroidobacteraceae bacterium]
MTVISMTLEQRVRRLEDRAELRELAARYCVAVDDRDIDSLGALFTADGGFRSQDGVMNAQGRAAVLEQFRGRFAALKVTNHVSHEQILTFGTDPDSATGLVTSHAEVWRNGRALIAALRYQDTYRREQGSWRFADRLLAFLYYLPVDEYVEGLGSRLRMRAYADQRPADYPESLPAWKHYHGDA